MNKFLISLTAIAMLFGSAISNVYANKPSSVMGGVIFAEDAPPPADDSKEGEPKPTEEPK